ncbi:cytochrome P450 [Imleria badia]|nr:cytochrome P450 [Imleria badia]
MTPSTIAYYTVAFGCIGVIYIARQYLRNTKPTLPLPPGPPGLPWVGNVIGVDANAPWLTYREWAKTYGDIVHSRLFGRDIIIINSEKIAKDLLDRRSSNTSDRPYFMAHELCGIDFSAGILPYGDRWRLHRRFLHQSFRNDALPRFLPIQHNKGCQFLRHLFGTPEQLEEHVFEYAISIALNIAYDDDPPSHDDALIKIAANIHESSLSVVRSDIIFIVDAFPILLKLPAWLPGMSFKKEMATSTKLTRQYMETAFKHSLQRLVRSTVAPFVVHDAMQNMEEKGSGPDELWMQAVKESHEVLTTFFLVMTLNPAVQEKAHAQIDAVVGKDRLPTMDDRPLLPFIDATFRELLRYSPVTPLSVPHASVNDDIYGGFHIPKGEYQAISLRTSTEYITYGFGRRICVGRHFADTSLWSVIAKVLAVFKVLKPLDENGVEVSLEPKFSSGFSIHPLPFRCRIVPRMPGMDAEKLEALIAASTA